MSACSLWKLFDWNPLINLDDPDIGTVDINLTVRATGGRTPRRELRRVLQAILHEALDKSAAGLNLFYDSDDDCIRGLGYYVSDRNGTVLREFLPIPGYVKSQFFTTIRRYILDRSSTNEYVLRYRWRNAICEATVIMPHDWDVRLTFVTPSPTFIIKETRMREPKQS